MKKRKLMDAMGLADEKYVAEADPDASIARQKKKAPHRRAISPRTWGVIAASLLLAVTALNLVLFIPFATTPPSVAKYSDSPYYSIIQSLNVHTFKAPRYKNNFEKLMDTLTMGLKDAVGEAPGDAGSDDAGTYAPEQIAPGSTGNGEYVEVTDNQVAGVTEADRIKRSDKYIFYLHGYTLYVYTIGGEDTALAGKYDLSEFDTALNDDYNELWEFYLSKDCNTVTVSAPNSSKEHGARVTLISLDVSDPANIIEKARVSVSGSMISTRKIDGELLLMTNFRVKTDADGKINFDNELDYIPSVDIGNGPEPLLMGELVTPETLTALRYTVICKLDENDLAVKGSTALLSYSEEVYVSKDNIYATHGYSKREVLTAENKVIDKKVTEVAVISYTGEGFDHKGTFTVDGYIKDQYSLDEYEGIIRIVTTEDEAVWTDIETYNKYSTWGAPIPTSASLYCVSLDSFEVVASVKRFAPDHEIVRSVRFDGDKAYVCTSVQITDPVFFFDLSDLTNITYKDTGVIEGYSTSLVSLGDGYLMGIGTSGRGGLKIEIYEESEDGVISVAKYELEKVKFSEEYKSYYIDKEHKLIGIGVQNDYLYQTDPNMGGRYIVIGFDGYNLAELMNVILPGAPEYKRGVYIDGYMYAFGGDRFEVKQIDN